MGLLFGYLFIFAAKVIDVTLTTFRTLMVVQGRKAHASIVGFFEIVVYILALNEVVGNLDNPLNLLTYALGFSTGNYVGIKLENSVGMGNLSAQIILKETDNIKLIEELRESGFGVTVLDGEGRSGDRDVLLVIIKRKKLNELKNIVYKYEPSAFITTSSVSPISGGYFPPTKRTKRK